MFLLLANIRQACAAGELLKFTSQIFGEDSPTGSIVQPPAFFKARMKMKWQAFPALGKIIDDAFMASGLARKWRGFRPLALDGSTCQLPPTKEIWSHFPPITPREDYANKVPVGRFSYLYDPLNHLVVGAALDKYSEGELTHAETLFADVGEGDLVLMDRGYSATWVMASLDSKGARFCVRMKSVWKCFEPFVRSGLRDQAITIPIQGNARKDCLARGVSARTLRVRLVRVDLENGEVEVVATNLRDTAAFPAEIFKELYHWRWFVEEAYKSAKSFMSLENFSGKSVLSVMQDFYAKVFAGNLLTILSLQARRELDEKNAEILDAFDAETSGDDQADDEKTATPRLHKLNRTIGISVHRMAAVPLLFRRVGAALASALDAMTAKLLATPTPVRPGRSFERQAKYPSAKFKMNYKPTL